MCAQGLLILFFNDMKGGAGGSEALLNQKGINPNR